MSQYVYAIYENSVPKHDSMREPLENVVLTEMNHEEALVQAKELCGPDVYVECMQIISNK